MTMLGFPVLLVRFLLLASRPSSPTPPPVPLGPCCVRSVLMFGLKELAEGGEPTVSFFESSDSGQPYSVLLKFCKPLQNTPRIYS